MVDFFSNPISLLEKAKSDFDHICLDKSEREDYYAIFNCLVSLTHIFEWVINSESISIKIKKDCFIKFDPYDEKYGQQEYKRIFKDNYELLVTNDIQKTIREVCNNLKHYKIKDEKTNIHEKKDYLAQCGTIVCGGENAICGYYEQYHFMIIDYQKKETDIVNLIQKSIKEWELFFEEINNENCPTTTST